MSAYARAIRLNEWQWEVFCNDCRQSIGTMTGDILSQAIIRTANRGGVKCPDCRKISCTVCGINSNDIKEEFVNGKCWYCIKTEEAEKQSPGKKEVYLEVTLV